MFCPKCNSEYRSGFTYCNDCEVPLVYRFEPPDRVESAPEEEDEPNFVPLATVTGQIEAGQIRSFLEAGGIPTEVRNDTLGRAYGDGLGGIAILVPRELEIDALDLLERADRGELEIDAARESDDIT